MDERMAVIARRMLSAADLVEATQLLRLAADLIGVDELTIGYGIELSKAGPMPHIISTQPPAYWADYQDSRIYELSPTPAVLGSGIARTLRTNSLEPGSRAHAFLCRWNVSQLIVMPLASPPTGPA